MKFESTKFDFSRKLAEKEFSLCISVAFACYISIFEPGGGILDHQMDTGVPHHVARVVGADAKKRKKNIPLWVQIFSKVAFMGAKSAKKVPLEGYF